MKASHHTASFCCLSVDTIQNGQLIGILFMVGYDGLINFKYNSKQKGRLITSTAYIIKQQMHGTVYANPTFIRKNIKQPTIISIHPLVAYDEHRLYFNNTSVKWDFKDIVNCTFSNTYKVLLVLTDDYKIYVFTENLELITYLHNWEPKYIVGFKLIESLSMLLLVGTEEVEVMKINILTNVKRTKFLSSMKFHIKKENHLSVKAEDALKWNKGYGYLAEEDLLYVWSTMDIHFFSLTKLVLKSRICGLAKKENPISTVLFSNHYKYTIIGLLNGEVKVWRLPISSLYHHKEILIHSFIYHTREIQQIVQANDHKVIITTSLDLYVCFMSIETFEVLRTFNFSADYSKLCLFSSDKAYAIKDGYLGELNYGNNMEFVCELNGSPIHCDRSPHRPIAQQVNYSKIQITLNSNISYEYNLQQIAAAEQVNKINIKHLYPPLKSKNVTQVLSCPFYANRYFMMVEQGEIFGLEMVGNVGRIDKHYVIGRSVDSERHPVNQSCSYIAFLNIVVPEIDTEMIERTQDKKYINSSEYKQDMYLKLKLLTVGTNRGSIIFYRIDEMETVYCRISYHREKITCINQACKKETNQEWLLSICEQRYLKIIVFNARRANCLHTLFCGEIYSSMVTFQNCMAMILHRGIFELCFFETANEEPAILVNRQAISHEDDILSLDYSPNLKLILTSAKDHKIKIWTTSKILLSEIVVDSGLQYSLWGQQAILVFHENKLYCLRDFAKTITKKMVAKCEKEFHQNFDIDENIILSKFLENGLTKMKEKSFKVRQTKKYLSLHQTPQRKGKDRDEINLETLNRSAGKMEKNEDKNETRTKYDSIKKRATENSEDLATSALMNPKTPLRKKVQMVRTQQSEDQKQRVESDLCALRKHIEELMSIRKAANESTLPKIKPKNEDLFVQFMREKLLNKKLLTRRDITLNRIIMKNLIKDHISNDEQMVSSFNID